MPFDAETFDYTTVDPLTLTEPRQRLEYLRDFLRKLDAAKFNMRDYVVGGETTAQVNECGTAACIAGWTTAIFCPVGVQKNLFDDGSESPVHLFARQALGLSSDESWALFMPWAFWSADATPRQAAAVIDHLLKTGEVDWSVADCGA